jgi:hypothetical protein
MIKIGDFSKLSLVSIDSYVTEIQFSVAKM